MPEKQHPITEKLPHKPTGIKEWEAGQYRPPTARKAADLDKDFGYGGQKEQEELTTSGTPALPNLFGEHQHQAGTRARVRKQTQEMKQVPAKMEGKSMADDVSKTMKTKEGKTLHFDELEEKIKEAGGAEDPAAVAAKVYREAGGKPSKVKKAVEILVNMVKALPKKETNEGSYSVRSGAVEDFEKPENHTKIHATGLSESQAHRLAYKVARSTPNRSFSVHGPDGSHGAYTSGSADPAESISVKKAAEILVNMLKATEPSVASVTSEVEPKQSGLSRTAYHKGQQDYHIAQAAHHKAESEKYMTHQGVWKTPIMPSYGLHVRAAAAHEKAAAVHKKAGKGSIIPEKAQGWSDRAQRISQNAMIHSAAMTGSGETSKAFEGIFGVGEDPHSQVHQQKANDHLRQAEYHFSQHNDQNLHPQTRQDHLKAANIHFNAAMAHQKAIVTPKEKRTAKHDEKIWNTTKKAKLFSTEVQHNADWRKRSMGKSETNKAQEILEQACKGCEQKKAITLDRNLGMVEKKPPGVPADKAIPEDAESMKKDFEHMTGEYKKQEGKPSLEQTLGTSKKMGWSTPAVGQTRGEAKQAISSMHQGATGATKLPGGALTSAGKVPPPIPQPSVKPGAVVGMQSLRKPGSEKSVKEGNMTKSAILDLMIAKAQTSEQFAGNPTNVQGPVSEFNHGGKGRAQTSVSADGIEQYPGNPSNEQESVSGFAHAGKGPEKTSVSGAAHGGKGPEQTSVSETSVPGNESQMNKAHGGKGPAQTSVEGEATANKGSKKKDVKGPASGGNEEEVNKAFDLDHLNARKRLHTQHLLHDDHEVAKKHDKALDALNHATTISYGNLATDARVAKVADKAIAASDSAIKFHEDRTGEKLTVPINKALTSMSVPRMPRAMAMAMDTWRSATSVITQANSKLSKHAVHHGAGPLFPETCQEIDDEAQERATRKPEMFKSCEACGRTFRIMKSMDEPCPTCSQNERGCMAKSRGGNLISSFIKD